MTAIGPETWGPHIWKGLHFITLAYPSEPTEENKKQYKTFFESIQYVLPCSKCSNNYKDHLKELPLDDNALKNKENLVKWAIDLHNIVNKSNGKKEYGYEEAINLVINNYKEENESTKNNETKIQMIEKKSKKNIDFNEGINKTKDNKAKNNLDLQMLSSFWFWLLIFMILVSIAVIYKKS